MSTQDLANLSAEKKETEIKLLRPHLRQKINELVRKELQQNWAFEYDRNIKMRINKQMKPYNDLVDTLKTYGETHSNSLKWVRANFIAERHRINSKFAPIASKRNIYATNSESNNRNQLPAQHTFRRNTNNNLSNSSHIFSHTSSTNPNCNSNAFSDNNNSHYPYASSRSTSNSVQFTRHNPIYYHNNNHNTTTLANIPSSIQHLSNILSPHNTIVSNQNFSNNNHNTTTLANIPSS
eukprot:138855_1